jgi:hypothetical protein
MRSLRAKQWQIALTAFVLFAAANGAAASSEAVPQTFELAQAGGTEPRDLEPRYHPEPPVEEGWYNSSYIFAVTRSVADSTLVPAAKVPLYLLTVPVDLVLLPFATIGGFFG